MAQNRLSSRDQFLGGSVLAAHSGLVGANFLALLDYRRAHAQSQPLNAAMSSAGLAGTWNAQGKAAAENMCKLLGVNLTWFDGQFDPEKQRAKFDQIATQTWDFVAIQPNSIGTLVEPITGADLRWSPGHRHGHAGCPTRPAQGYWRP